MHIRKTILVLLLCFICGCSNQTSNTDNYDVNYSDDSSSYSYSYNYINDEENNDPEEEKIYREIFDEEMTDGEYEDALEKMTEAHKKKLSQLDEESRCFISWLLSEEYSEICEYWCIDEEFPEQYAKDMLSMALDGHSVDSILSEYIESYEYSEKEEVSNYEKIYSEVFIDGYDPITSAELISDAYENGLITEEEAIQMLEKILAEQEK